jgi:hypothetical protein
LSEDFFPPFGIEFRMSEYSESYHLRASSLEEGSALLQRAGIDGFVLPPMNGWVTILCEGVYLMPNRALIEANQGILLHYEVSDEHGWGFELFNGYQTLSRYLIRLESTVKVDTTQVNLDTLADFVKTSLGHPDPMPELTELLDPNVDLELFGYHAQASGFLRMLGIEERMWLSYQEYLLGYDPHDPEIEGTVRVTPA